MCLNPACMFPILYFYNYILSKCKFLSLFSHFLKQQFKCLKSVTPNCGYRFGFQEMKRPRTHLLIICACLQEKLDPFSDIYSTYGFQLVWCFYLFSVCTQVPHLCLTLWRDLSFSLPVHGSINYTRGRSHAFVLFCLSTFGGAEKRNGRGRGGWGYLGWEHLVWHYINKEWQPGKTGERGWGAWNWIRKMAIREACQSRVDQQGRCAENKDSVELYFDCN